MCLLCQQRGGNCSEFDGLAHKWKVICHYTSTAHNLRFFKVLKAQGKQGAKNWLVFHKGLNQAARNRGFKKPAHFTLAQLFGLA